MPARHRRQKQTVRKNAFGKLIFYGLIATVFLLAAAIFIFVKFNTKNWDGREKVSFTYPDTNGNVKVMVLDPELSEITTITIDGFTQAEIARNYGQIQMRNVWQLGINEKLNGELLAETVTRYFHFPTHLWSASGMDDKKKFLFSPGKSNIPLGDRLAMVIFALKVKGIDSTDIDMAKNQYLRKLILADGTNGFTLNGPISGRLTIFFADNYFSRKSSDGESIKYKINDETGKNGITNKVGEVLEVLGGKVVAIDRRDANPNLDCEIYGKDDLAVRKVGLLFKCKITNQNSDFDVELSLGPNFAKRY